MRFDFSLPMRILKNDALAEILCILQFQQVNITANDLIFAVNGVQLTQSNRSSEQGQT